MRSANLVSMLFILGAVGSPLPSLTGEVIKRVMDRSLPESMLVYANKDKAKREPIDGHQPEGPVVDAIMVEDKKAKRTVVPAYWGGTESDDEDTESV